jgi:hypothetical protein
MDIEISSDAELDIVEGYYFYEDQAQGLGHYFRDCIVEDINSLDRLAGIHERQYGFQRLLAKRFPFVIIIRRRMRR